MKKKLIITESQYRRLINEQDDYTEQLLLLINSNIEDNLLMVKEIAPGQGINLVKFLSDNIDKIQPPYFYKFNILRLNKNKQIEVFKNIFGDNIIIKGKEIYDSNNNQLYYENSDGDWNKSEYDEDGNMLYFENSDGYWSKYEYDSNGYGIYRENSKGYWLKKEFDSNGNQIYYENSKGIWEKHEYDENGKPLYIENSENGIIMDRR